jgi:exo-beta-1,3-glucanase (GH17 family)
MNTFERLEIPNSRAICYSGFRQGQKPGGPYPSYEEIKEDLSILEDHWSYLRLYDVDQHCDTVLQVIQNEGFRFQVMMGVFIEAEVNNYDCPWGGGIYPTEELNQNADRNQDKINKVITLSNQYENIICAISVGNEACVDWTDHAVPVEKVISYARQVKANSAIPVTFCENYVPWLDKLEPLAQDLDFISIHTYPVWEYKNITEALAFTKDNYYQVAHKYPNKPVVITEAGWATKSNGRGIPSINVNEDFQETYFNLLMEWTEKENILTFFFEAFDEAWKGSPDPLEPEKHWGLFYIDRSPKRAMQSLFV